MLVLIREKRRIMRIFPALTLLLLVLAVTSCAAEIKKAEERPSVVIVQEPLVVQEPLCRPPLIEYAPGLCCVDEDNNTVCDEAQIPKAPEVVEQKIPKMLLSEEARNTANIRAFEKGINAYFDIITKYTKEISNSIFPTTVAQRKSLADVCSMLNSISDELRVQSNKIVVTYAELKNVSSKATKAYVCYDNLNEFLFMQIKCAMSFTCFRAEYVSVCSTLKKASYEQFFDVYGGVLIRAKESGGKGFMGVDTLPCEMEINALRQYVSTEAGFFAISGLKGSIKENMLEITGLVENIGERSKTATVKATCGQAEAISELGTLSAGESKEFTITIDGKDAEYCEVNVK